MIFLDLDGVIVDFVSDAFLQHKTPLLSLQEYPSHCGWDVVRALNFVSGQPVITANEFWYAFDYDFWFRLPKYPGADEFVEKLEELDDVFLATSPALKPECVAAKVAWIKENLPKYSRRFFVTPCKAELGFIPGAVLIDDYDENCKKFAEKGGKAITLPRPWNHRGYMADPYTPVLEELVNAIG